MLKEARCFPQVAHTSHLLMQWRCGDDSNSQQLRYAELEGLIDSTSTNPEVQSSDITSESFKLLPLDAQIQAPEPFGGPVVSVAFGLFDGTSSVHAHA